MSTLVLSQISIHCNNLYGISKETDSRMETDSRHNNIFIGFRQKKENFVVRTKAIRSYAIIASFKSEKNIKLDFRIKDIFYCKIIYKIDLHNRI